MRVHLFALLASLALVGASNPGEEPNSHEIAAPLASVADERNSFRLHVMHLLETADFGRLEALAADLRATRACLSSGHPKLDVFYEGLARVPGPVLERTLPTWVKEKPESATPHVVSARVHLLAAWKHRGREDSVSFAREQLFHDEMERAWSALAEAERRKGVDPALHTLRIQMLQRPATDTPRSRIDAALADGMNCDPTYVPLYEATAHVLLPTRRPPDHAPLADFVKSVSDTRRDDTLYAHLVAYVALNWQGLRVSSAFDWERVRRGYDQILEKYPQASRHWNLYLMLAQRFEDRDKARSLVARLRGNWSEDSREVWRYPSRFDECVAWARGSGPEPPPPGERRGTGPTPVVPPGHEKGVTPLVSLVAERRHLQKHVEGLLASGQFEQLEAMADAFRRDKPRFVSGLQKLYDFYGDLAAVPPPVADRAVASWLEAMPRSVAARIVKAKLARQQGGRARGGGFSNTVSEAGWRILDEKLGEAWSILMEAERITVADPVSYEELLAVCRGSGVPKAQTQAIWRRGVSADPTYDHLHLKYVEYLLPRWHGSSEDVERFAAQVADERGDLLYARIVWFVASMERHDLTTRYRFSWERARKGFGELLEKYPLSSREWNAYLWLACEYKDRKTAAGLAERLRDHWSEDAVGVWEQRARFAQCVAWATAGE